MRQSVRLAEASLVISARAIEIAHQRNVTDREIEKALRSTRSTPRSSGGRTIHALNGVVLLSDRCGVIVTVFRRPSRAHLRPVR